MPVLGDAAESVGDGTAAPVTASRVDRTAVNPSGRKRMAHYRRGCYLEFDACAGGHARVAGSVLHPEHDVHAVADRDKAVRVELRVLRAVCGHLGPEAAAVV